MSVFARLCTGTTEKFNEISLYATCQYEMSACCQSVRVLHGNAVIIGERMNTSSSQMVLIIITCYIEDIRAGLGKWMDLVPRVGDSRVRH